MSSAKSTIVEGLQDRLKEAFGTEEVAEIVREMGKPVSAYQTFKNYLNGQRTPTAAALKEISEVTGYSIHWLVTGMGPKKVESLRYQDEEIEWIRAEAITDYVRELLSEQLGRRRSLGRKIKEREASGKPTVNDGGRRK